MEGFAAAEAMLYIINKISNSSLLPNITIGYDIRDDCNTLIRGVEAAFDFLSRPGRVPYYPVTPDKSYKSSPNTSNHADTAQQFKMSEQSVIAVVGPANSDQSLVTSTIFSTVLLPQISYSASSQVLSDKTEFTSFFRLVPSDWVQVKAMIDVLLHLNWTYVSLLGSDTNYGRLGLALLEYEAAKVDIKIAMKKTFSYSSAPQVAEDIMAYINSNPIVSKSKVFIIFASPHEVYRLLKIFQEFNFSDITYFASESWTLNKRILNLDVSIIEGTLGLRPYSETPTDYQSYLESLSLKDVTELDTWFQEYLIIKHICSNITQQNETNWIHDEIPQIGHRNFQEACFRNLQSSGKSGELFDYLMLKKVPFVLDAVYVIAHALHKLLCSNGSCLKRFISNKEIFEMIKQTKFDGQSGFIEFNEFGDISGAFSLFNIQKKEDGHLFYRKVGHWNCSYLVMDQNDIVWKGEADVVISRCDQPCPPGTRLALASDKECWTCVPCGKGQFTNAYNMASCLNCTERFGTGWGSNKNYTSCEELPQDFLSWNGHFAVGSLLFSSSCLLFTLIVLSFFVKYRHSHIVKGSNRELTYVLFVSLILSIFSPYVYIGRPTHTRCMLQPNYLSFVMSSSVLVIYFKTDRILCIFNAKPTTIDNLHLEKRKRDRLQILCFLVIELIICGSLAASTYFHQPTVDFYTVQDTSVSLGCSLAWYHQHAVAFVWFTILILGSIYKAYRVRKLPENFNEARQINFTLFILFLIWVLVSVGVANEPNHGVCSSYICIAAQLHTLVVLVFMLIPKLRIIIFQPTKNSTEAILHITPLMLRTSKVIFIFSRTSFSRASLSSFSLVVDISEIKASNLAFPSKSVPSNTFKLGRKVAETAHDINDAFGPGTTNERTVEWWFKKFRNGGESLEDDKLCLQERPFSELKKYQ
ncbi:metabotropic glutamate receptor 2 [Octopus bimaculoides]|nr:metabotropic glutamate receptor 2 [Octopus bimaculoides]|eukprot:XP_014776547.1 PREDICTED: metabotropic glutamate receptor 2-like [Octopus bimaculoides]